MDAAGLLLPLHVQLKQRPGSRPEPVSFFIASICFQVHIHMLVSNRKNSHSIEFLGNL